MSERKFASTTISDSEEAVGITLVDVQYAVNTSSTNPPIKTSNLWKTLADPLTGSQQLWTRTKTVYSNGNPTYSTPANITPKIGATGQGVESITEQFYLSNSKTTQTGSSWKDKPDEWVNGKFMWTRSKIVYKNPTDTKYTEPLVSSEWVAIDELEIGGRNLILNSLNRIDFKPNNSNVHPTQDELVSGENYRRFRRTYPEGVTDTVISTFTTEFFTPEKSGYYTYSTYFRPNEFDIELRLRLGASVYGDYTLCKANEWTQVSVTAYLEAGVETRLFGVYGEMPPEAVQWIDYNRVSVTSGTKAIDWTPAPEDIDAKIDGIGGRNLNIAAQIVEGEYFSHTTGAVSNLPALSRTPYIEVEPNTKYTVNSRYGLFHNLRVVFFDEDKNFTRGFAYDAETSMKRMYTTLVNEKYITLSGNNNLSDEKHPKNYGIFKGAADWAPAPEDVQAAIDKAQADANVSLAKTKGFTQIGDVEFEDGLIFTSLMKLLDAGNDGEEMAGISGIAGDNKEDPAFWAGGTYEQAIGGTAKAIIRHDGTSKFTDTEIEGIINALGGTIGDLAVEPSGRIAMYMPNTTQSRLTFRATDIPALQSLLSTTVYGGDFTAGAGSLAIPQTDTSTQTLTGSTYISQTGSTIEITGGNLLTLTCDFQGVGDASVGAALYLMRGSVKVLTLASALVMGSGIKTDVGVVQGFTLEGMPSGTYTLMLEVNKVGTQTTSGNATIGGGIKVRWDFIRGGIRNFLFGLNGFLSFFSNNHIYFTEENGLDVRGKTNMPGVLASGTVAANGGQANTWGAKASAGGTSTVTGGRRVPLLNLAHNNYTVQITPHTSTVPFRVGAKTSTGFEALGTGAFDYTVIGSNY